MSQFKYTLPSGAEFVVNGPPGATQAQADKIFYEQVAAGALVGYVAGQTLTGAITQISTQELSRLDRGTAGVPGTSILGSSVKIVNGVTVVNGINGLILTKEREAQAIAQLVAIINGLPQELKNDIQAILVIAERLPILAGVSQSTILSLIQIATQDSKIPTEVVTTPDSIPSTILDLPVVIGYPTLIDTPLENPVNQADIVLVKDGAMEPDAVGTLSPFQVQVLLAQLANSVAQDADLITQEKGLGKYGFTAVQLEKVGYVKPGTFTKYIQNTPEDFVSVMNTPSVWTGKGGVYTIDDMLVSDQTQTIAQTELMQEGYTSLTAAGVIKPPTQTTVNISSGQVYTSGGLQSASALTLLGAGSLAGLVGSLSSSLSGQTLSSLLSTPITNLTTLASGAVNSITSGINNLSNLSFDSLSAALTNQVTGQVGALVTNASKFGAQAASLWAKAGSLSDINFSSITNLAGLNGITSGLTNLVPGQLSGLTSAMDVFGKASQFSLDFANPLSGLSLDSLPSLSSLTSGALGSLEGALSNLGGSLSSLGSLGSLGSLANLGSLGSLGSLFGGGGDLVSGTQVAGGFNNTINRQTVDAAFVRILGSSKIPVPVFTYPSAKSSAARLDIAQAESVLSSGAENTTFGQTVTI
jgi:hypothetical protein